MDARITCAECLEAIVVQNVNENCTREVTCRSCGTTQRHKLIFTVTKEGEKLMSRHFLIAKRSRPVKKGE